MHGLPTGTITLLFTDIEGSTKLLHELGGRYAHVLGEHRRVLREAFAHHHGTEVDRARGRFLLRLRLGAGGRCGGLRGAGGARGRTDSRSSLAQLALASLVKGETERSEELFAESLPQAFEGHDRRALDVCLHGVTRLAAAAERVRESLGNQPGPSQLAVQERYLAAARAVLGNRFGPLEAAGRELSLADAVALATTE